MRHANVLPTMTHCVGRGDYAYLAGECARRAPATAAEREQNLALLQALAHRMIWEQAIAPRPDNSSIPAGYTYLGQLIAHDLTFNAAPLGASSRGVAGGHNLVSPALDLDCIYGGGPDRLPWLYCWEEGDPTGGRRARLRLGLTRPSSNTSGCPMLTQATLNDLPRVRSGSATNNLPDAVRPGVPTGNAKELYEPLTADPRSEDTLMLSQLVVLFHKLHNRIVAKLGGAGAGSQETFRLARALTRRCYRAIIAHDYLRRLLDRDIWQNYLARYEAGELSAFTFMHPLLASSASPSLPAEFTMAAFRIGHVMIRQGYELNRTKNKPFPLELLMRFTGGVPGKVPITADWVIEWPLFFPPCQADGTPQPGANFQASHALIPAVGKEVNRHPSFAPSQAHRPLQGMPPETWGGLMYRDLARGFDALLPSGQELSQSLFGAHTVSTEELRAGLAASLTAAHALDNAQIDALSQDTPLFYYILREAELAGGRHLGRLGSTIVAEVIFAILTRDVAMSGDDAAVDAAAAVVFGAAALPPRDMPALIEFTTRTQ